MNVSMYFDHTCNDQRIQLFRYPKPFPDISDYFLDNKDFLAFSCRDNFRCIYVKNVWYFLEFLDFRYERKWKEIVFGNSSQDRQKWTAASWYFIPHGDSINIVTILHYKTRVSQKFCNIWGTIQQSWILLQRSWRWWTTLHWEMLSSPDTLQVLLTGFDYGLKHNLGIQF